MNSSVKDFTNLVAPSRYLKSNLLQLLDMLAQC